MQKNYKDYKVERVKPRGRPEKTWTEVVEKDCWTQRLHEEDIMDHSRQTDRQTTI